MRRTTTTPSLIPSRRSGQAILEFAVVAFVMTFLLGAMLTFGFLFFGANVLQQAADVGAMEMSRHPAPPTSAFEDALTASGLFDEAQLVVPVGTDAATLPLINRLLFSVYIYDPDIDMVRYPGALVTNGNGDQTVVIPLVGPGNRNENTGVETISEWRKVVEEVLPASATEGPYSMTSTSTGTLDPGTVALRINYPYQSAALVAYIQKNGSGVVVSPNETIGLDDVLNVPVTADDSAVSDSGTATFPNGQTLAAAGYTFVNPSPDTSIGASASRGTYGFGKAQALNLTVRPYRKVLSAQAIYRREVFE